MQGLQNRAARIITGNFDYVHVRCIDIVKQLKWMTVIERRDYLMAPSVFKCLHGMAPLYLSDCDVAVRDTRASTSTNPTNGEIFKNSFLYIGPLTWNALPERMQLLTVLRKLLERMCSFNRSLIMCFFNRQCYNM